MGTGRKAVPKEEPEGQLDLIVSGQMDDGLCPADKPDAWTLAQVRANRPRDYARAVRMLALGIGQRDVAECCRFSPQVVVRIARDEIALTAQKEGLAKACMGVSRMAFDALAERLADPTKADEISAGQLAVIGGIAGQRGMEFSNGGVQLSVKVERVMTAEEWDNWCKGGSAMGSGARESAPKDEEKGADAPRVYEARESRPGEVIDLPADPAN